MTRGDSQSHSLPELDRPWRRLAWIVPASLCLWIALLIAFSAMLGESPMKPMEAALMSFEYRGGSGSNGAGSGPSGGGPALSRPVAHSLLVPNVKPAQPISIASKTRRKALTRRVSKPAEIAETLPTIASRERVRTLEDSNTAKPEKKTPAPDSMAMKSNSQGSASDAGQHSGGNGSGDGGIGHGTGAGSGDGSLLSVQVEHPPIVLSRVLPDYPRAARVRGLEGKVVLRAIVDSMGRVERKIDIVESVPLLDDAAINALRQWRFEPARDANNHPIRVVIQVPLRFTLR